MDAFSDILKTQIGSISLEKILSAAVTAVICLVVIRLVMRLADRLLSRTRLDERIRKYTLSALRCVLWVVAVISVVESLGIPTSSLVAMLSVVSLAFSLAAESVLSNMAGGLVILVNKPFNIGDFVESGNISGTVAEITLNYTKLDTVDGRRVLLPNKELSAGKIVNYTTLGRRRVEHKVTASYDDAPETVVRALLDAAAATGGILTDPAPAAQVESYGESAIEYSIRCWTKTEDYWPVYYALLAAVKTAFDGAGVTMTYNHLNVHLVNDQAEQ